VLTAQFSPATLSRMRLLAPAKINLHLRVFGVQSDGFHPLLSWMCTVGLFDIIEIERIESGVALSCDDASIPCDARNLVYRAADMMLNAHLNVSVSGLRIHLCKRIPAGGGLGGGSSDAARMLLGLNRFLGMDLAIERTTEQLAQMASRLGSDVPFFLHGPSSICQGRGEIVHPIARPRPRWATLVLPGIAMPTPRVYQVFDSLAPGKAQVSDDQPDWKQWTSLNADELLPRLVNDLEAPAFQLSPQLGLLRSDLEQALGRIVRMSGSGSTLFTLFDEEGAAQSAADAVAKKGTRAIAVELGVTAQDDAV
jgi:4-diphosphocytidyl-2-C-methyl-D-erythritol kinase